MREPPTVVTDRDVVDAVRTHWSATADGVEHLPVGFGAHHWRVSDTAGPQLFATWDQLGVHHTAATLEGAYSAAAALCAGGLAFVVAPIASRGGSFTVELAGGRLSCTPWLDDPVAGDGGLTDDALARSLAVALARLHEVEVPAGIPRWRPLVPVTLAELLEESVTGPWDAGPFGETARVAIRSRHESLRRWTSRYHHLGRQAEKLRWVPTHGEPHTGNLLATAHGPVLVDWESLALAPPERDLRILVDAGHAEPPLLRSGRSADEPLVSPDWSMIEMFDLEWRLDEVSQYAARFSAEHRGTADDAIAIEGLLTELARPDVRRR